MSATLRILRYCVPLLFAIGFLGACGYDDTLREYLDAHFWLPFSKFPASFVKRAAQDIHIPYAGMEKVQGDTPLEKLRVAYQQISGPVASSFDVTPLRQLVSAARADKSLIPKQREETELIDAKIDMRSGEPDAPELLQSAKKKLEQFLRTARTPEFLSEARGWLAHVDYLLGDQTAAGKIYLDELNREGSNLSRATLLTSLRVNYGYDGGQELLEHLGEYFDTPEHAAFAIQLVTNPHWYRGRFQFDKQQPPADRTREASARIQDLLEKHGDLLKSESGANALALLGMRTALRMGDPPAALKIAEMVSRESAVRREPDFAWMLASARFLTHDYAAAEQPLLDLFRSSRSSDSQKAAAAYGLCGVYRKTKNTIEQIRYALWLRMVNSNYAGFADITDQSIYWASSGWDLNLLLETEAPIKALQSFLNQYPTVRNSRIVKYSLAVRLARANRYEEAANIYQSINALPRAARMRQLGALYEETNRTDVAPAQLLEAKYVLAVFLHAHPNGIYFNDILWYGLQRYALYGDQDGRFTREDRQAQITSERQLKDDQDERWRAYLLLRDIVQQAGRTELGDQAARLAVQCLRGINVERFGREAEIRNSDIELSNWVRQQ